MDSFEPIINLIAFLTALSVASERITNVMKLGHANMRIPKLAADAEKERERQITTRGVWVGIVLAVVLKADMMAALHRLDSPWATLGWLQMHGSMWTLAPEAENTVTLLYAIVGSIVTGTALGFGSKFWHEMLDTMLELRNMAKLRNTEKRAQIAKKALVQVEAQPDA
jgi:hypothetical protein